MRILCLLILIGIVGCSSTPTRSGSEAVEGGGEDGCQTPLGFIREGQTATGYLHSVEPAGQSCQQGTLSCRDGNWSGPYIYPSCVRLLSN